jgi:gluconate 2-dehydrogenase gamma chain
MAEDHKKTNSRRSFLKQAAGIAGATSLLPTAVAAQSSAAPAPSATAPPVAVAPATAAPAAAADSAASMPYQSLSPDEASFIEALVNVMCPADEFTPSGVDCGLATYIDRQLAGPYGKGTGRYLRGPYRSGKPQLGCQLPLTPEEFSKSGIAAANALCKRDRGRLFAELTAAEADEFLLAIQGGQAPHDDFPLALWFNEVIYPLFVEACFADPMYGGNRNAVFWKMIGYPGLPAAHALDMVRYRGKPFPGAERPKSIADFT